MNLNFLPYSMYAEGFVTDEDANLLEGFIDEDILNIEYQSINSSAHNFYTSSPNHNLSDDNIKWEKYKDVFMPYISTFLLKLTDNVKNVNLELYLNLCRKGSFIAPHYDGIASKTSFMMLYCPKKYKNEIQQFTSYLTPEKYYQTFNRFEKMPLNGFQFDLAHERGKFFIVPTNLMHWVTEINEDVERITLMTAITPEFKE